MSDTEQLRETIAAKIIDRLSEKGLAFYEMKAINEVVASVLREEITDPWRPMSEKPDKDGEYWGTFIGRASGRRFTEGILYLDGKWKELAYCIQVAWMPKPEPASFAEPNQSEGVDSHE